MWEQALVFIKRNAAGVIVAIQETAPEEDFVPLVLSGGGRTGEKAAGHDVYT